VIDRFNLIKQDGAYEDKLTAQILPPGMAGYQKLNIFPTSPNQSKAKALFNGNNVQINGYFSTSVSSGFKAQILHDNLKNIGLDLNIQQFSRGTQIQKEGTKGADFDLTNEGWIGDYPDPYTFFSVLLDGSTIHDGPNNENLTYYNDPGLNNKIHSAATLTGDKRAGAYAALDKTVTQSSIWAPYGTINEVDYFSKRMGCLYFDPAVGLMNLNLMCTR
jgi:ABC-type oligopeptide transport system substrate-binding subunit